MPVFDLVAAYELATRPATIRVYCDESSTGDRWCAYGGLWIPAADEAGMREQLLALRQEFGLGIEIKWRKSGNEAFQEFYLAACDVFLRSSAALNVVLYDTSSRRVPTSEKETRYYRDYHWVFRKRARPGERYDVTLDRIREIDKAELEELRNVLNHSARNDHGPGCAFFRTVTSGDSKNDDLLQVADLLVGAVAYHANGRDGAEKAGRNKRVMAELLAKRCQNTRRFVPTSPYAEKVNIWRFESAHWVSTTQGGRLAPYP